LKFDVSLADDDTLQVVTLATLIKVSKHQELDRDVRMDADVCFC
jgi:hypothetical protein